MAWNVASVLMAITVLFGGATGVAVLQDDGAMLTDAKELVSGMMMDEDHSMGDHSDMTDAEKAAMREQMQGQRGDMEGHSMDGDHNQMRGQMGDHADMTDAEKAAMREQMQGEMGDHQMMDGDHSMHSDHSNMTDEEKAAMHEQMLSHRPLHSWMDMNHSMMEDHSNMTDEEKVDFRQQMIAKITEKIDKDGDGVDKLDIAKACNRIVRADNAPELLQNRCTQWANNQIE